MSADSELPVLLSRALARMGGGAMLPLSDLVRLSGGANMESWSFNWGGAGYVLRRAPSALMMEGRPYGHATEAALIRAAHAEGVKAPEVVGVLEEGDGLGTGFVMRRVEAEVNPATILADPPPSLLDDLAREMARIHAIAPRDDITLPHVSAQEALAGLKRKFLDYGGDRPVIALAFQWCEANLPPPSPPALVHGDFRMGNVMVDSDGLAAVLDWEAAHWGDPIEDIGHGCVNSWRFGRIDNVAFGLGSLDDFLRAYQQHGGRAVEPERMRYWLVYRTLWWAVGCLTMAQVWRSGADRSVERTVIGRRTVENEADLLLLLEADAPECERAPLAPPPPASPRTLGEPSTVEMIEALREWIERAIKPGAQGRAKFEAAVAMNALGILAREAANPVEAHDAALSADILAGTVGLSTPGLLASLRKTILAKLANDSPKYSALARARALWLKA